MARRFPLAFFLAALALPLSSGPAHAAPGQLRGPRPTRPARAKAKKPVAPATPAELLERARTLMEADRFDAALPLLKQVALDGRSSVRQRAVAALATGVCHAYLGSPSPAQAAFTVALQLDPSAHVEDEAPPEVHRAYQAARRAMGLVPAEPADAGAVALAIDAGTADARADAGSADAGGKEEGAAEEFPPPTVKLRVAIPRATGPVAIDGKLNDAAWAGAATLTAFTQVEPNQGHKPTLPTVVKLMADEDRLYISARCSDPAGAKGLQQRNLRRDFDQSEADYFAVVLDTLGDGRNGFGFAVNPWGAQLDIQVLDDQLYEPNWDTVWFSATTRDDSGWSVEIAIPFRSLRMAAGLKEWGVQLVRNTHRVGEQVAWSPYPRAYSAFRMSYAGVLEFPEAPHRSPLNLQLRPYLIGRAQKVGVGNFVVRPTGGGEVTWAPTAGSVLDLTGNTDFAETDVDKRVVNLGRYSVYFPEKRQFFLESAGVFSSGLDGFLLPFYSRSIGLSADGLPVPINAGARFVARSPAFSFGALAVNSAETTEVGSTLFGVVRYVHNFGESDHLGGMLVARRDFATTALEPSFNVVPVLDGLVRLGPVSLNASGMGSATRDGAETTRWGGAGVLTANYQANWGAAGVNLSGSSSNFEARSGFVARPDVMQQTSWLYLDFRPAWLPKWMLSLNAYAEGLTVLGASDRTFQEAYVYAQPLFIKLRGGDAVSVGYMHQWEVLNDVFSPIPGLAFAPGRTQDDSINLNAYSDPSRVVFGSTTESYGTYFGATQLQAVVRGGVQPIPHISLSGSYEFDFFRGGGVQPGGLRTHLLRLEGRLGVSPQLQLFVSYQRDTAADVSVLFARLSWEFLPLSYVHLVFTDTRGAYSPVQVTTPEMRIALKATYTWRL